MILILLGLGSLLLSFDLLVFVRGSLVVVRKIGIAFARDHVLLILLRDHALNSSLLLHEHVVIGIILGHGHALDLLDSEIEIGLHTKELLSLLH